MKKLILTVIIFLHLSYAHSQDSNLSQAKIEEDLNGILSDLSHHYAYLQEKNVDVDCLREYYGKQITNIKTQGQVILFFEYLLDEFYDSHLILTTNTDSSFRLFAPIYAVIKNGRPVVSNVWQTQIENLEQHLVGAEILKINGTDFDQAIEQFPTHCHDKGSPKVREWVANKILAGRYNQPRRLTLRSGNQEIIELDIDSLKLKQSPELLTSTVENGIGVIRINNSLGNNTLVSEFDRSLTGLMDTRGLIIDLRNTVDGGNSYVARGIMGRFINEPAPYQRHLATEQYDGNPTVQRSWVEYVIPRKEQYKKPVVVLVGRWTGSMGEGLAIGFEGMKRAKVVGSEMERLSGEMNGFSFKNQSFGYRLSTAQLFHINGTPREKYVPTNYVKQTTTERDETLEKGMELIHSSLE